MKFASEAKQIMKNETKTGLTSGAKLTIPNCDYWGEYDGYKIYKCYAKRAPDYDNIVFAIGTVLYMNGKVVGMVDNVGRVSNWNPNKAVRKYTWTPVEKKEEKTVSAIGTDELLKRALNRSIEEMVGPSLADYNIKYSE